MRNITKKPCCQATRLHPRPIKITHSRPPNKCNLPKNTANTVTAPAKHTYCTENSHYQSLAIMHTNCHKGCHDNNTLRSNCQMNTVHVEYYGVRRFNCNGQRTHRRIEWPESRNRGRRDAIITCKHMQHNTHCVSMLNGTHCKLKPPLHIEPVCILCLWGKDWARSMRSFVYCTYVRTYARMR